MNLRDLQTNLPWTIKYSTDFRSNPQAHKDFAHTVHHVVKAVAAFVDDMDHDRALAIDFVKNREEYGKYVADLVVCALRLANTFPGGTLDLESAVVNRIESKNDVKLSDVERMPPDYTHGCCNGTAGCLGMGEKHACQVSPYAWGRTR